MERWVIRPISPEEVERYSDSTMTALFNAYVTLTNSERQTIWQRYSVMLIANTFVFGFLRISKQSDVEVLIGSVFGLLLCCAWMIIQVTGYKAYNTWIEIAKKFQWDIMNIRME